MTRLFSILLIYVSTFTQLSAQGKWDPLIIKKAHSAKDAEYMSQQEKAVIYYTNLARLDPKTFLKNIAKPYIDSTDEKNGYTASLLKTLGSVAPMSPMEPNKDLFLIAKPHALNFGKTGKTGHDNLKKRFEKYMRSCNCRISENADYGYDKAIDIVMHLLIDTDIKDLGHRKHMLDPKLTKVGVSIQPHKIYEWNCVMDFSE